MRTTMRGAVADFEDRLLLSPWWVASGLGLAGGLLFLGNELQLVPVVRTAALLLILLLYLASALLALLTLWRPWLARWFALLCLLVLLQVGLRWFATPSWLALLPTLALVAFALLGLKASLAAAAAQTLLLLLGARYGWFPLTPTAALLALIGLWLTQAIAIAFYHTWQTHLRYRWQSYERTRQLLEEARDRNAFLEAQLDKVVHTNRQADLLNERLAAMRMMAEEAQRAKSAFVAKVSHEFRTPLNMIIGLTDLLVETPTVYGEKLPPPLLHDLEIVHRNCAHLASLIDDVLDLSQAEAGRLTLHKEWVELTEDIQSAVAVVEPLLQKKHLRLEVTLPESLPKLYCDRKRIRQVILNLLSNAARYTERGAIVVKAEVANEEVIFSVADTGPGIAAAEIEQIFEPFYQVTQAYGLAQRGSGLGLTISKQFVELHDGKLWAESQPNVGSTFFFRLRAAPAPPLLVRPEGWIQEAWMWLEERVRLPAPQLPRRPRLVAYDRWGELGHLLAHSRIGQESELVETQSLTQAIEACQSCPAHLLLINAPAAELWSLMEAARQAAPDTLILGNSLPSPLEAILAKGALDYLIKPVTRADLVAVLQAVGRPVQRILLVDDDAEVRELLARMLLAHDSSLQISDAENGAQALQALTPCAERPLPDLILLDMLLPDKTGLQILEEKQVLTPAIRAIPVVVISAQDPGQQPLLSHTLVINMTGGLLFDKVLHAALDLAAFMLAPATEADQAP